MTVSKMMKTRSITQERYGNCTDENGRRKRLKIHKRESLRKFKREYSLSSVLRSCEYSILNTFRLIRLVLNKHIFGQNTRETSVKGTYL